MSVRIMVVHPISNPRGPECWDGKAHTDAPANLKDVRLVGAWLTKKTGFRFSYKPGYVSAAAMRMLLHLDELTLSDAVLVVASRLNRLLVGTVGHTEGG